MHRPRELRIRLDPAGPRVTCIRVRRGRVVLDYRDSAGRRRVPSFGAETDEEAWAQAKRARARLRYLDDEDAEILFEDAWEMWLEDLREQVDEASRARYEEAGRLYLAPTLKGMRVARIRRRILKVIVLEHLAMKKADGAPRFSRLTVQKRVLGVASNFLQWCVDEEIIVVNPARELGRRLFRRSTDDAPKRKSMAAEQMVKWTLAAEQLVDGRTYLGLMLMLDGALRISEMLGLRYPEDFDVAGGVIHVRRQVRGTRAGAVVKPPKTARGVRDIEMSARLKEHLEAEMRHRGEKALAAGGPACPWVGWAFSAEPTMAESETARKHYQRAMRRLCAAAGIGRFTPHALRHTWGTLQAEHGAHQKALQAWYGHATASQTDHYIQHARPQLGAGPQEPAGPDLLEKLTEARRPRVEPFTAKG